MYIQLKSGHDTDRGPAWISWVTFNRTWKTATWRGRTLRRSTGLFDANFFDVDTWDQFWISGPRRDRREARYSSIRPEIDEAARAAYAAFVDGRPLPGRERG